MSWQNVDTNLLGSGKISKAAILGQSGGVWASSPGYQITFQEERAIVGAFKNPSQAQANGIRAGGVKFFTLNANDTDMYGKKGAAGIVVVKTSQAVIVAEYSEGVEPGDATKIVHDLGDYLISMGY